MTTSPTDQSGPDASESAGDSVSSLLPAELLLSVLSLCCPISRLPSTCRALSASLSPGSQPQRIWFQHLAQQVIFRNPEHNPKVVNWCYSPELPHHSNNERYPSIAQIESPMSYYLKASIPADGRSIFRGGCASGLAPEPGSQLPATIFTKDFVQVLFSSAGPFAKFQRHNVETDLVAMLERIRPDEIFDDDGSGQPAFARTWHLIPDAFLLATFFIRTSQLDLLHVTLTHLRSLFPTLGAASAPFQIWSRLMLDNRTSVLAWLSNITAHSDLSMTYPTFLCFLALLDWSLPALQVISRVFADSCDASTIAALVTTSRPLFSCLMCTLEQITSPPSSSARVVDVLCCLRNNKALVDLQHFAAISVWTGNGYPIFLDVFRYHDMHNLHHLRTTQARYSLGRKIARWISQGRLDLVSVAVDHDLFDTPAKGEVLCYAASRGDKALQAMLAARCIQDNDELCAVVLNAIHCNRDISVSASLLNFLFTCSSGVVHPSDFILDHAYKLSHQGRQYSNLQDIMFASPAADLLFTWDFTKHMRRHLNMIVDWARKRGARVDNVAGTFMAKLVYHSIAADKDVVNALDLNDLASACAILLGGLASEVDGRQAFQVVDASHLETVDFLVSAVLARMHHPHGPRPDGQSTRSTEEPKVVAFSKLIPRAYRFFLHAGIAKAATLTPSGDSGCMCGSFMHTCDFVVHPLGAHNVLVDKLLRLDRAFVLASVPTKIAASVRVWSRFEASEIASELFWHRALSLLRQVVEPGGPNVAANVAVLVDNLPRVILESGSFALGVYGLMQRFPEHKAQFALGLDQSQWIGWAERVARFAA